MNASETLLKVIVFVHFILSTWGSMGSWIPGTYLYVHGVFLACGCMAILLPQSADAIYMMLATLGFSILEDVVLLSLYEPRFHVVYEENSVPESTRNEYRFALGMCILNLILKPFSGFILWRILTARNEDTAFTIPGIESFPSFGGQQRGYENIDNKVPTPTNNVETATPHYTSPPSMT